MDVESGHHVATLGNKDSRIPITLLTGFLGAGKTTLLNRLLRHPDMAGAAVLINEFGEVGIDHHLVDAVDESMIILDSGCICCSVQGDLVKALRNLAQRSSRREIPPLTRVVIETTGLADPVPVVITLIQEQFVAARYRCDGVITVVDATHATGQLERHREAVRQVVMADRLLISKCDLASDAQRRDLNAVLDQMNSGASRIDIDPAQIVPNLLFDCGIYTAASARKAADVAAWLGVEYAALPPYQVSETPISWRHGGTPTRSLDAGVADDPAQHHDRTVRSFVFVFPEAVSWTGFAVAMGNILQEQGDHILRVKGLMNIVGDPLPRVIHCVQNVAYPPLNLARWPEKNPFADHLGRLVFIVRDLDDEHIAAIRLSLAGVDRLQPAASSLAFPLPTRCWLAHDLPGVAPTVVESSAWVIQARRFGRR